MPWKIEENYKDCRGYAVVKQPDGSISGCHTTLDSAQAQMRALYSSEGEMGKEVLTNENVPNKNPQSLNPEDEEEKKKKIRVNVVKENGMDHENLQEGMFVMGPYSKGIAHGKIEHVMRDGGLAMGSEFEVIATVDDPAILIRMYEESNGSWQGTDLFTAFKSSDATLVGNEQDMQEHTMEKRSLDDLDLKPTESMANNAKRGLELRRKFGRGGTAVGVARARDLSNRTELSPDTVLRMYSFFSRHEVDKKGKDFNNSERPSNGKIAWLLWGGDSGYSWATSKRNAIMRIRDNKMNKVWQGSAFSLNKHIDKSL